MPSTLAARAAHLRRGGVQVRHPILDLLRPAEREHDHTGPVVGASHSDIALGVGGGVEQDALEAKFSRVESAPEQRVVLSRSTFASRTQQRREPSQPLDDLFPVRELSEFSREGQDRVVVVLVESRVGELCHDRHEPRRAVTVGGALDRRPRVALDAPQIVYRVLGHGESLSMAAHTSQSSWVETPDTAIHAVYGCSCSKPRRCD